MKEADNYILNNWPYGSLYQEFKEKREGYIAVIDLSGKVPPRWAELNKEPNIKVFAKKKPEDVNPEINRSINYNTI